jgi:hypothetical protein
MDRTANLRGKMMRIIGKGLKRDLLVVTMKKTRKEVQEQVALAGNNVIFGLAH